MKLLKRMAVCLLAAAMALSMLTACDDGGDAPAASSNPPASSGSTDTGTKDPDPPASTEPDQAGSAHHLGRDADECLFHPSGRERRKCLRGV